MSIQQKRNITGRPIRVPKALQDLLEAAVRAHLDAVEKFIAVMDQAAGDADLEAYLSGTCDDDREEDVGDEGELGADEDMEDENRTPVIDNQFAA